MHPQRKLLWCVVAVFSFSALSLPGQSVDFTGTWIGSYSAVSQCGGNPVTTQGNIIVTAQQTGNTSRGIASVELKISDCQPITPTFVPIPFSVTVSGNSFSGSIETPDGIGTGSGSITGNSLTFSFKFGDTTVNATLSRTSSGPPASGLTGSYTGSFTETFSPCGRLPLFTYSGGLSASLEQFGSALAGTLIVTGGKTDRDVGGTCTVVDDDPAIFVRVLGKVEGTAVSGLLIDESGDGGQASFSATVSGNTITGKAGGLDVDNNLIFNFTLTRTSTTPPPPRPVVSSFAAHPAAITTGEFSTLVWTTRNASGVTIDNGVGAQPPNGSARVSPTKTTTYTLTATGSSGATVATTTVTVATPAPRVVVSSTPRGMVQSAGTGGGTDSFTLTNIGTLPTTVALAKGGDFFNIATQSVTLGPRESQPITITGLPQNVGTFSGTVTATGAGADGLGVRVRLLSVAPPTGAVQARALQSRSEISAPAGQSPSASVNFTNSGNATLRGMVVSDAPWIVPQSELITIEPGQTVPVTFTADFNKRPDAAAPLGAVTGTISLLFLRGSAAPTVSENAPGTTQVSTTLVYVVKPGTSPGTPPPLTINEVALFVPGLANRSNASGDLMLSNKLPTGSLSDVKLYLTAPGVTTQLASLPNLTAGASALFPSLLKNVFAASAQTGTAQVRTADTTKISVAGIQSNTSSPAGTFSTSLPLLRSDRGVSNGSAVVLSGLTKETGQQTNIYVQELSGVATTVQIQSLDSTGAVVATRAAQSLEAFGLLEVLDAIASPATAARVLNLGNGRIGAFALVTSTGNGDAWIVTDPGVDTVADGTMIVPLFSAGIAAQTHLYATNRSSSAISATIDVRGGNRRRAIGKIVTGGSGLVPITHATSNVNLAAQQSFVGIINAASTGFIRITAPAGVLSAVGRTLRSDPGQPSYGSGLPAIAVSSALATGEARRFAGVDDASPASRAARTPATFRSNLMLIETANTTAVARVTLRYTFAAGTTVTARAESTREYTISASQFVVIQDVIADVIGTQRSTFGDLRNIDIDVEVVSGGRVIPVLQSIDNGSDDSVVRVD